jgi:Arc/MetJ-type ribon-helix-helix transcriptional regulator
MVPVKTLEAKIPITLYSEIEERIRLGLFPSISEAVQAALQKAFAQEARGFLRKLAKNQRMSKAALLKEWKKIRN